MSKRSKTHKRRRQDAYDTPPMAVDPLLEFLRPVTRFVEPCAGRGDLTFHLEQAGHRCRGAYDIAPRNGGPYQGPIGRRNAATENPFELIGHGDVFITNPPWSRERLHPIILNLARDHEAWLLFDADWSHTLQAREYLNLCRCIVAVGRVRWFPDTPHQGYDNCAWYRFGPGPRWDGAIRFYGRAWS